MTAETSLQSLYQLDKFSSSADQYPWLQKHNVTTDKKIT